MCRKDNGKTETEILNFLILVSQGTIHKNGFRVGQSSSSFIHTYSITIQQQEKKKKKKEKEKKRKKKKEEEEVKTELTIHWIKHNKEKKCVAAKGAKLPSWLLPQSGYKWVEVIRSYKEAMAKLQN